MELIIGLVFLMLVGAVVILPVYLIAQHENHSIHSYLLIHIIINAGFILWSIYDLYWTQHYIHGPSTLFIILPAWPLLMIFYAFLYLRIVKKPYAKKLGISLAMIYFSGVAYETAKELLIK